MQVSAVVALPDPTLNDDDSDCDPSSSSEDSDSEDEMLDPETATSIVAALATTAGSSPTENFGRAAQVAAMAWHKTNTSRLQTLFP